MEEITEKVEAIKNDASIPMRSNKKTGAKSKKEVREEVNSHIINILIDFDLTYQCVFIVGTSRSNGEIEGDIIEAWLCHWKMVRNMIALHLAQQRSILISFEIPRLMFASADMIDQIWAGIASMLISFL